MTERRSLLRLGASAAAAALVAASCGTSATTTTTSAAGVASSATSSTSHGPAEPGVGNEGGLVHCDDLVPVNAPDEAYRETPIYVANEQPIEAVQAWAATKPGYEGIWIDRDRQGWITVAFSQDADAWGEELARAFPDVGVVAVPVEWTAAELSLLQARVVEELGGQLQSYTVGSSLLTGYVTVGLGVLTPERLALVAEGFGGERVCVDGADPADAPAPGPQQLAGDGWRLLADEPRIGHPYRTGIAADESAYLDLWTGLGLPGEPPDVDFEREVVIWFGAVFGSSCPELRLERVVVDHEAALVYAEIVLAEVYAACRLNANPRAYVVAVERATLPAGPFAIQLDADGPPAGAPEERTLVHVDLTAPGATLGPGDAGLDPGLPEPRFLVSGDILEPGFAQRYRLNTFCGIEHLGELNFTSWKAETTPTANPPEWEAITDEFVVEVSVRLLLEPEPTIIVTAGGVDVVYVPTTEDPPPCD